MKDILLILLVIVHGKANSEGIKFDSWVKIHGRTIQSDNDTISIKVECSSCRKPHQMITEFLVNGKTLASVWQDDNGSCIHKGVVCEVDVCNCTDTGNLYSLNIDKLNNDSATEFSCVMQFEDTFRNGRFSEIASMTFIDGDFIVKQSILEEIKENEPIPTSKVITNTLDESNNHEVNIKSPKTPTNQGNEMLIIVASIGSACFLALIIIIGVVVKRKHKRISKKDGITENSITTSPIQMCKGCFYDMKQTRAEFMCFDCREKFCKDCRDQLHNTMKLQHHKSAELKCVPTDFTLSIFICSLEEHDESLLEYICYSHKDLVCKKCRTDIHSTCQTEALADMSSDKFDKLVTEYLSDLDSTEETLVSFLNSLKRSLVSTKLHMSRTIEQIMSSTQTKYQLIWLDNCTENLPKSKLTKTLETIIKDFETEASQYTKETKTMQKTIRKEKEKFDFVSNYAGSHHIMALTVCGTEQLKTIKSELRRLKLLFKELHISIGLENNVIYIRNEKRDVIQPTTKATQQSMSIGIPVETDQSELITESPKEPLYTLRPIAKISPNNEGKNRPHISAAEIGKEETIPLISLNEPVSKTSADSSC